MIIDWFINFLLRHRLLVTILVVAATAAGLRGMCMLTYDEDPRNLLKSSQNDKMALEEMLSSFASEDRNCIIVLEAQDILAPRVIEIVYQLVVRLQRTKGVRSVDSLFGPQLQRLGNPLVPGNPIDEASSTRIDEMRREAASNPLLNGHLLSADMQTTLVIVQLDTKSTDVSELEPMIRGVQSVVDESTEGSRVHARISGVPNASGVCFPMWTASDGTGSWESRCCAKACWPMFRACWRRQASGAPRSAKVCFG